MTNRRDVLRLGAMLPMLAPALASAETALLTGDDLDGARLYADVKRYADLGEHRTGLFADQATAAWLKSDLDALGFATRLQPFDAVREDISEASLLVGEVRLPVFPQWPVRWTQAAAVKAPIARAAWGDSTGFRDRIVLTRMPRPRGGALYAPEVMAPLRAMLDGGPAALIIVTDGPTNGIIALNVRPGMDAFPCPVALMAPGTLASFEAAVAANAPAALTLRGTSTATTAHNVVATRGTDGPAIVVTTPISGWFRCAGERGPGIALWRAMARHVARQSLPGRWTFAATSGHEIGGLGGHAFLQDGAPPVAQTRLWLHLGAGFATYAWRRDGDVLIRLSGGPDPARFLTASTAARRGQLARLFTGQPAFEAPALVGREDVVGEAALWMRAGYGDVVGFVAGHTFHHVPGDGPETTGPELLAPIAQSCAKLLEEVARA